MKRRTIQIAVIAIFLAAIAAHELVGLVQAYPEILIYALVAAGFLTRWWWVRRGRRSAPVFYTPRAATARQPEPAAPAVDNRPLALVQRALIRPTAIMNKGEAQMFRGAIAALESLKRDTKNWHVHAQAALGELMTVECSACAYNDYGYLKTRCDACAPVFSAFNCQRADIVICDNFGFPVLAIEHQGGGHIDYSSQASVALSKIRNQVKQTALEKPESCCCRPAPKPPRQTRAGWLSNF